MHIYIVYHGWHCIKCNVYKGVVCFWAGYIKNERSKMPLKYTKR